MTNSKSTKRALVSSALAILMCVAMLIGTTFAWFTDTASTGVNKIQAGNLDVALEMYENDKWVNAEGKILNFKKAEGAETEEILWEPGCRYELPELRVVNKGNLALKYKIQITGIDGDAKLNEVIDWTITGTDVSDDGYAHLAANDAKVITILGEMRTTAGNEYQGLSIDGIAITVFATQDTVEYDSFNNTYDAEAGKDTAIYTLSEFNALTEIPAGIKNVYLNIGAVSLKNGDVTIGNKEICDMWTWDGDTDHYVGEILEDGRKVYMVRANDTIYSSNKAGITLYISGSVNDNPEGGLNQSDSHSIIFSIPDASNVVFTKDFTVNGYFRMYTGWSDGRNLGGAVYDRTVKSVLFDRSTFNGIWIQNSGFYADSLTLDGCNFNAYENKVSANDSNPLWFCNIRDCDITVQNCSFKASRPIKVVEQAVFGAEVKILNNTFDMSLTNSADNEGQPKNDAIMFSTLIEENKWSSAGTLGSVEVKGNTVTGANALLTFFNPSQITMANGATFKVSDNILNGAKLSVEWKTATEYAPDFVK